MNTINSVYYGWAFLIACGGGSYYMAKRSLAADREQRAALEYERRRRYAELSTSNPSSRISPSAAHGLNPSAKQRNTPASVEDMGGPSGEARADPSPAAAEIPKSKWEASEPYRSPRGDRFSRIGRETADKSGER